MSNYWERPRWEIEWYDDHTHKYQSFETRHELVGKRAILEREEQPTLIGQTYRPDI